MNMNEHDGISFPLTWLNMRENIHKKKKTIEVNGEIYVEISSVLFVSLQAEKRKMLTEHETQKIKELEEHYSNELREWKAMLIPRKQVKYKSWLLLSQCELSSPRSDHAYFSFLLLNIGHPG